MSTPVYPQLVTLRGPGPDALPIDDTTPMSTKGVGFKAAVTITRPANTTAYTGGDAIGQADVSVAANAGSAILEFASMGLSGGHIVITSLLLEIDLTAIPSGMTNFRLHLYDAAPDAVLDNAVFDLSSAGDRGKYLGFIDIAVPVDIGSTLIAQEERLSLHRKLAAASTSIFGVLQTIGGYTPASGTVYKLTLRAAAL